MTTAAQTFGAESSIYGDSCIPYDKEHLKHVDAMAASIEQIVLDEVGLSASKVGRSRPYECHKLNFTLSSDQVAPY